MRTRPRPLLAFVNLPPHYNKPLRLITLTEKLLEIRNFLTISIRQSVSKKLYVGTNQQTTIVKQISSSHQVKFSGFVNEIYLQIGTLNL